jgi:hypothetical protein
MSRILSTCLLALTSALTAQDVREQSTPTGHYTLKGVTSLVLGATINTGYRLVDIDYRETNALGAIYDAVLVQNSGAYSESWWWYTGQTAAQVNSNLAANNARLIDIDPYVDPNGNVRFNCVMVDNTGANAKQTWWYSASTTAAIGAQLSANNARLVDLDSYTLLGITYYAAVMTANTGADARAWWWYLDVTPAQISSYLNANSAQLYDLEPRSNGRFDCVMLQNPTSPAWYWWTGISGGQVDYLLGQYGIRAIDIDSYLVGGTRVYSLVGINNSNALTTTVGNAMRSRTDGQVGCWLQRLNSTNLANLNGDTQFEPASTMKTLHHVVGMRAVSQGLPLTTNLTVYSGYNGSCPQDTGPAPLNLQTTLQRMMENSDNACTQAVRAYFTELALNTTASALGMADTSSNHRLGCPEALTSPNRITLRDLNTLHTQVANGYLGSQRALFYQLMLDSVNDLSIASIINAEGAALGLSSTTIASFRNFTDVAHKGGNYAFPGQSPPVYHRCEFGYLSLPFITNDVITPREFGFGAFVNFATVDADAQAAIYTDAIPELLRPQIRAALQSWTNSLAGVASLGAGCGGYTQTVSGLPRLGAAVVYNGVGGYANGITMFAVGFSSSNAGGVPLPFNLQPLGGEFGCVALNDIQISAAGIASSAGGIGFPLGVPNAPSGIGFQYYTQMYSFGPSSFRTSNGQRSIVGL